MNGTKRSLDARIAGLERFYWTLAVLAVVGAGAVGLALRSRRASAAEGTGPVQLPDLSNPTRLAPGARGQMKGDSAAPLTIVEFADFQCPYCGTFAVEIEPQLERELIATGKARLVFYDFPLVRTHAHAFVAARAARCAEDQQKFWEYHDALFENQARWAPQQDPRPVFAELASSLGLDAGAFGGCLASDRHTDVVTANLELGKQLGVDRTPTVILSRGDGRGRKVVPTLEDIANAIRAMESGPSGGG